MRPQIVTILTLLLFMANGLSMLGQSAPAKTGPPPPAGQRGPLLPIDSDIYWLLLAGLLLGLVFVIRQSLAKRSLR